MSELTIALSNIRNIKTVNIEGLGVIHVRRLGSGEELDLSAKLRRLSKLIEQLSKINFMQYDATKPGDVKKIAKLNKKVDSITDEIEEIKRYELQIYKKCFSDDKSGEIVDIIMNTLTEAERTELIKQVFGEVKPIETNTSIDLDEKEAEDE